MPSNSFTITQQINAGSWKIAIIHIQDPPPPPSPNMTAQTPRITDVVLFFGLNEGQRQGDKRLVFSSGPMVIEAMTAAEVDAWEAIFRD